MVWVLAATVCSVGLVVCSPGNAVVAVWLVALLLLLSAGFSSMF